MLEWAGLDPESITNEFAAAITMEGGIPINANVSTLSDPSHSLHDVVNHDIMEIATLTSRLLEAT